MPDSQIQQREIAALFAEIGAIKLILLALLKGSLPTDKGERWAELEAMIHLIEDAASKMAVRGADNDQSKLLMQQSLDLAREFVRGLSPKFQ